MANKGHLQVERQLAEEQPDVSPAPYQDYNFPNLWAGFVRDFRGQNNEPKPERP